MTIRLPQNMLIGLLIISSSLLGSVIEIPTDYVSIQAGIDEAINGDTILVQPGTYIENINFNGKNIVVGSLMMTMGDTSYISQTIIDGSHSGSVVSMITNEDSSAVLYGFTIQNGYASGAWPEYAGGGIRIENSSPSLNYLVIRNNEATHGGGISLAYDSNSHLQNLTIKNNTSHYGAGISALQFSNPHISNTNIVENSCAGLGGGIRVAMGSTLSIERSLISENRANVGGGIYLFGATEEYHVSISIANVTLVNNSTFNYAGAMGDDGHANTVVQNSIFWNNVGENQPDILNGIQLSGTAEFGYSAIEGGHPGAGNISDYPSFIDSSSGNFYLQETSPCIDTGNPDLNGDGDNWEIDPDDQDPDGTRMDMGAYYYHEAPAYAGPVWHVSTDGSDETGDGTFALPFATIQHGLNATWHGDTLIVQPGLYDEDVYFFGKSVIVGSQHLLTGDTSFVSSTIIDGMVTIEADVDSTALLTGFTIQNSTNGIVCTGDPLFSYLIIKGHSGNGMSVNGSNVSVSHTTIHSNDRGISANTSEVSIYDTDISLNNTEGGGAGILFQNGSLIMDSVRVEDNTASNTGGGIVIINSTALITQSSFSENLGHYGGGIYGSGSTSLTLHDVNIHSNQASNEGGGLFLATNGTTLSAINCQFTNNISNNVGGGISLGASVGDNSLTQCSVQGNTAISAGGGIYFRGSSPVLTNVLITDNEVTGTGTDDGGGGIYLYTSGTDPIFNNVTIANNVAAGDGGGIFNTDGQPDFTNTIIYHNAPNSFNRANLTEVSYSDVEGGFAGEGNINSDPLFIDMQNGDYHLSESSPCIDTGNPDMDGDSEIWEVDDDDQDPDGTRMDMGALYFHHIPYAGPTWHVSNSGSNTTGDGSEENPFQTIQKGISESSNFDTVLVLPGTYYESVDYSGKFIVLGSLFLLSQDTSYISSTIIDGSGVDRVVTFNNSENNVNTRLSGFTIQNGYTHSPGEYPNGYGGGIFVGQNCSPTLDNLIVKDCYAQYTGGGIQCEGSPRLKNLRVYNNQSETNGGGVFVTYFSYTTIDSSIIYNNTSNTGGGLGVTSDGSNAILTNCLLYNNTASVYGGGIYLSSGTLSLMNCTISDNTLSNPGAGGGLYNLAGNATISHTIIFGNSPGPTIGTGEFNTWYSCTSPVLDGIGNINVNPLFVSSESNNYTLSEFSLCIDTGNPDFDGDGDTYHIDLDDRDPDGSRKDIGAFYFDKRSQPSDRIILFTPQGSNGWYHYNSLTWSPEVYVPQFSSYGMTAAFDNESKRSIVVGTDGNRVAYDYASNNYESINLPGDLGNVQIASAYDGESDRVIILGNEGPKLAYDYNTDTYEYLTGVTGESDHGMSAVYDSESDRVLLFTHQGVNGAFDYNTSTWTTDITMPDLSAYGMAAAYDSESDRSIIVTTQGPKIAYDYNSNSYEYINLPGTLGIEQLSAAYDVESDRIIVISNQGFNVAYDYNTDSFEYLADISGGSAYGMAAVYAGIAPGAVGNAYQGPVWHVSTTGSDESGDGSPSNPFLNIQYALQHVTRNDTIILGPGEYFENVYFNHDTLTVIGDTPSASVVNGGSIESCFIIDSSQVNVFNISFTNGSAQTWPKNGSGIRYYESIGLVKDCKIFQNTSTAEGSGAGGIGISYSNVDIDGCEIYDNTADDIGGGISYVWATGEVTNSKISSNIAHGADPRGGGGVAIWHSDVSLEHNLIYDNSATRGGGVWIQNISNLDILNCTITENSASERSGGISQYDWSNSSLNIENSVIWNNTAPDNPNYGVGEPDINYSIIQWPLGTGNINEDPLLLDDYNLSENSPAIDSGNPDLNGNGSDWVTDPDDQDPDGTRMDMGAYYYHQDTTVNASSWYVSIDGSDEGGDGSIELPYQTIQWAVSACSILDRVILLPGDYEIEAPIEFPEFPITIRSSEGFSTTSILGSQYPVFLNNTSSAICLSTIQDITFEGFIHIAQSIQYLPRFNNCKFSNNLYSGGGLFDLTSSDSTAQFNHCIFALNTATNSQIDGLFTGSSFYVDFNNCSFAWNVNGIFRIDYGGVTFNNCILRTSLGAINQTGKQANYSFIEYPDEFNFSSMYECIDGQTQGNPGFVDEAGGDLRLLANSICIDAGNPDLDGDSESWESDIDDQDPDGTRIDMGALYFHQAPIGSILHVSTDGSDETGDGSTESPFATIQYGINSSQNGDTVLVLPGTYVENINFNGKNIVLGSQTLTTSDTSWIHQTVIDGNNLDRVVTFNSGEDSTATLLGFTLTNGLGVYGGGIYLDNSSSPLISNTHITGNSADHGGGIFADHNAKATLFRCLISDNEATAESGGGIFCWLNSDISIIECEITQNIATRGAGLYCTAATPVIHKTTIHDNIASNYGGGLVFHGTESAESPLSNLTIYNNHATNYGGGVVSSDHTGILAISNTIIWSNTPDQISATEGSVTVEYSDVQSGWTGAGNIDLDPLMVDPESNDYHLNYNSPCIDSGDPNSPTDPDGTRGDMGAYYFHQSSIYPQISLYPDSLVYAIIQDEGLVEQQSLTISNTGEVPLEVEIVINSNAVTDIDGNIYSTVQIGDQVWMKDNLKVTHYRDGTAIPHIPDGNDWIGTSSGAYCIINNTPSELETYGLLYNWYGLSDARNISPEGWHVPTDAEWMELEMTLGMSEDDANDTGHRGTNEGSKLAGHAELWNDGVLTIEEEFGSSGFNAIPGGVRNGTTFAGFGDWAYFWSSSEYDADNIWTRGLHSTDTFIDRDVDPKINGYAIRCLSDEVNNPNTWLLTTDTLTIAAGGTFEIGITVNAEGMEIGDYSDIINIISNDPINSLIQVPVTMSISNQDLIPPVVTLNIPDITDQPNAGDTLQVSWIASDNSGLDWAKLWFSSDGGQSFILSDSIDANWQQVEWIVPDVISNACKLAIWVSDLAGNVSADTLESTFPVDDGTPPTVSVLTPTISYTIPEHDTVLVTWEAADNVGIERFELFYYNKPGGFETSSFNIPSGERSFSFEVPSPGVSDSAQIKIEVIDLAGLINYDYSDFFSVTDNTRPYISYFSIPDTLEWGIGSIMEIGVVATDNVEVTGLDLKYSTDNGSNWVPIVEELYPVQGRPTYTWLIPDIPGECQLQAVVADAVGLTDTSYSGVFSIFIEYPQLIASLPVIRPDGDMHLRFSQRMDSVDITSGTEVIGSVHGVYEIEGTLNGDDLTISSPDGFVSLDTLQLILTSSAWTNSFGYGLDGNGDGLYSGDSNDNDTSFTVVTAAGDYDQNGILNFDDFDDFVIAWNNDVSEYELAPHQGEIPFINIQPDSSFDIFDLATFASMWNWAAGISLSAPMTESYQYEEFASEQNGNELEISLSLNDFIASQTIIKYDPSVVQVSVTDDGLAKVSSSALSMVDVNPDSGFILITSSHLTDVNNDGLKLKLVPDTKQRYTIEIAFQGSDMDANVVQKRSLVELLPIPTSFSLSQNYPNPFNASTTIEYGLPKDSDLSISIYDIRGRFVKDIHSGRKQAGYHVTQWNGSNDAGQNVASGLYFIVLHTPEYKIARKALILK